MDRLVYEAPRGSNENDRIVYQVTISPAEKLFFEVARESKNPQNNPPIESIRCGDPILSKQLADYVNKNIDRFFIVMPTRRNRYLVSPISMAAYYRNFDNILVYSSPKYDFALDIFNGEIGTNISKDRNKFEIYFEAKLENEDQACSSGVFLFRRNLPGNQDQAVSIFKILPELGILEEGFGRDADAAIRNTFVLNEVNKQKVGRYLADLCSGTGVRTSSYSFEENIEPPSAFNNINRNTRRDPNRPVTTYEVNQTPPIQLRTTPSPNDFYTVKKGDTLYGIAKKQGISVADLRAWNDLGSSNLIRKGQRLRVREEIVERSTPTPATSYNRAQGRIESESIYDQGIRRRTATSYSDNSDPNRINSANQADYHTVRPGETVASIALKYGFTEDKFREINNLNRGQYVRIGEKLKVTDCNCPESYNYSSSQPIEYDFEKRPQTQTVRQPGGNNYQKQFENIYNNKEAVQSYNDTGERLNNGHIIHTVREKENLYQIARGYGTTVEEIMQLNNFRPGEIILPFQKIRVR